MAERSEKWPYHPSHDFVTDEDGDVDIFAFEAGEYHNGPHCRLCGGWCHHCDRARAAEPCPVTDQTGKRPSPPVGCCSACQGTGLTYDPSTGGRCWDCRGTGCAHLDPCHDERCEAEFVTGPNAWLPCGCASRKGTSQTGETPP